MNGGQIKSKLQFQHYVNLQAIICWSVKLILWEQCQFDQIDTRERVRECEWGGQWQLLGGKWYKNCPRPVTEDAKDTRTWWGSKVVQTFIAIHCGVHQKGLPRMDVCFYLGYSNAEYWTKKLLTPHVNNLTRSANWNKYLLNKQNRICQIS